MTLVEATTNLPALVTQMAQALVIRKRYDVGA